MTWLVTWASRIEAPASGKRLEWSWGEVRAFVENVGHWTRPKVELPAWCPAIFQGNHRKLDNLEGVTMLVFDLDDTEARPQGPDPDGFRTLVSELFDGYAYAAHTSYSSSPGAYRWRFIMPLAAPLTAERHDLAHQRIRSLLARVGVIVDTKSKDAAHAFFVPVSTSHGGYTAFVADGRPLDGEAFARSEESAVIMAKEHLRSRARAVPRTAGNPVARGIAYVAKCSPAVAGQGGHTTTFVTAIKVIDVCGLDEDQALEVLGAYNATCVPRWSERELRHKVSDAVKSISKKNP